jgi:CBS domain-containing protein
MDWRRVRHVPVEDDTGALVGMISHRDLVRLFAQGRAAYCDALAVRDVMKTELVTVSPRTPTLEALKLMRERGIGCLPVIREGKLVGLLTAYDFLTVSTKLFEDRLQVVVNDRV